MNDHLETRLRNALDRTPWHGPDDDIDISTWQRGRRRRGRRRAGAVALAGVAAATMGVMVWQSGLPGGSTGTQEPTVAAIPADLTTFVFAAPDAPDGDPTTISARSVPEVDALLGTTWELQDELYDGTPAAEVIGTRLPTVLNVQATHWGVLTEGCGAFAFEDLVIDEGGRFTPLRPFDADRGCTAEQQAAEDFWLAALSGGGVIQSLGGGSWLLVSVDVPDVDGGVALTQAPAPATEDGSWATGPARTEAPTTAPTTTAPTTEPPGEATEPPGEATEQPSAEAAPDGPAFRDPSQEWVDEPWPAGGGELFAPTVRAGLNEGFDRVVVDLTGNVPEPFPGWRAVWTENPLRDGSGLPAGVAGDTTLQVTITGMGYPAPGDPVYDDGDYGLDTHRLEHVVEVIRVPPFEGMLDVFVGVQGEPRPYRVFLLQDPMRLVIDVQH